MALTVAATAVVFDVPERLIAAASGGIDTQWEHTAHKVCDGTDCTDDSHTEITDWTAINDKDGLRSMIDGGHYYLTADITLTAEATIIAQNIILYSA